MSDRQLTSSQWKKNVKDIEGEVLCGMALHLTAGTLLSNTDGGLI